MLPDIGIYLALFLATFLVYSQVDRFEFISYDDPEYVSDNPAVRGGIGATAFKAAFTQPAVGNWIPATVLSHALTVQLFGLDARAHHLVNVTIHCFAALLLFAALHRATRARWRSAFVAAIFALHPVHVESVAWIAERKDVLSAFFAFAALYLYLRYVERPSLRLYLGFAGLFGLALLAKPMLVTFPFLLWLIDVWPLGRKWCAMLIWEKLPLILLSLADSVITYFVQGTAVQTIPLAFRIRAALESVVIYIGQMFWPTKLAIFYPLHGVPIWEALLCTAGLVGVSALAVWRWRTQPYLATGWFWFLGMLVPVIGIVQVGAQARADRYTYLPSIGLTIVLAWGIADLLKYRTQLRAAVATVAGAAIVSCMVLTARQTATWQNSGTVFQHALDVTNPDNYIAQNGLAMYLAQTGHPADAIPHFEQALRVVPGDAAMHNSVGILYANLGDQPEKAISHFAAAVRIDPKYMEAQFNLGLALSQVPGRESEALAHLEAAQRIQPTRNAADAIERLRARAR